MIKSLKKIILNIIIIVIISIGIGIITNNVILAYSFYIIKVPQINQSSYPTGCESVTTVMALNYQGYNISVDNFIDNYLNTSPIVQQDGKIYAQNPNEAFIGNPRSNFSYGCYAPVICNAIQDYAKQEKLYSLKVKNLTGTSLNNICKKYINNDIPIIVWATSDMKPSKLGTTWNLINSPNDTFTWISGEHCLLLIGYDEYYYYFNDPQKPISEISEPVAFDKSTVEKRYQELGCQAIAITNYR